MSLRLRIRVLYIVFSILSASNAKPSRTRSAIWEPESEYIRCMGNRPISSWREANKARAARNGLGLLILSSEIHKQICESQGRPFTDVIEANLGMGTLKFFDQEFRSMTVPVLQYKVEKNGGPGIGYIWYFVTKGPREDCVYYLSPESEIRQTYYVGNGNPVCDIEIPQSFVSGQLIRRIQDIGMMCCRP